MKNEWKRHRGSNSMPKCLKGKQFEARLRNGSTAYESDIYYWTHEGGDYDVMAYRVVSKSDVAPDYSKGFPEGTTAKDIGAKVGDEFVMVSNSHHSVKSGELVTLLRDDGTQQPYFTKIDGERTCLRWDRLAPAKKKTAIELQAEEVGIPEPLGRIDWGGKPWSHIDDMKERQAARITLELFDLLYATGQYEKESLAKNLVDAARQIDWSKMQLINSVVKIDASPERVEKQEGIEQVQPNKYQRTIKGVTVDVYDVLDAFGVTCQARGHAIKKLLMAGQRGHKDEAQDLREAVQATERSIELVKQK